MLLDDFARKLPQVLRSAQFLVGGEVLGSFDGADIAESNPGVDPKDLLYGAETRTLAAKALQRVAPRLNAALTRSSRSIPFDTTLAQANQALSLLTDVRTKLFGKEMWATIDELIVLKQGRLQFSGGDLSDVLELSSGGTLQKASGSALDPNSTASLAADSLSLNRTGDKSLASTVASLGASGAIPPISTTPSASFSRLRAAGSMMLGAATAESRRPMMRMSKRVVSN